VLLALAGPDRVDGMKEAPGATGRLALAPVARPADDQEVVGSGVAREPDPGITLPTDEVAGQAEHVGQDGHRVRLGLVPDGAHDFPRQAVVDGWILDREHRLTGFAIRP
jgi:hypothetical protein